MSKGIRYSIAVVGVLDNFCVVRSVHYIVCNQWITQEDTAVDDGLYVPPAKTLEQCQQACITTVDCEGLNWNASVVDWSRCSLNGPWSLANGTRSALGFTYYKLIRDCTTPAPTSSKRG